MTPGIEKNDPYNLQRFVDAQKSVFDNVVAELKSGRKRGHWMWFIFPQIQGLGYSEMSRKYAIANREEASLYVKHPVLGPRLVECSQLVLKIEGRSILQIFGDPDHMKLRSSMTLFSSAAPRETVFPSVLRKYFNGVPDQTTLDRM